MSNRTYKFRAWHKGFKKMTPEFELGATKLFYLKSDKLTSEINDNEIIHMQFTGLKDSNGVEIYDGDIVKAGECTESFSGAINPKNRMSKNKNYKVMRHEALYFVTKGKRYKKYVLCGALIHQNGLEVIGNKFENPELL